MSTTKGVASGSGAPLQPETQESRTAVHVALQVAALLPAALSTHAPPAATEAATAAEAVAHVASAPRQVSSASSDSSARWRAISPGSVSQAPAGGAMAGLTRGRDHLRALPLA